MQPLPGHHQWLRQPEPAHPIPQISHVRQQHHARPELDGTRQRKTDPLKSLESMGVPLVFNSNRICAYQ